MPFAIAVAASTLRAANGSDISVSVESTLYGSTIANCHTPRNLVSKGTVGAQLLETSRDSLRQKLARARRDLHTFRREQCGLINKANPCRCAKNTQVFMMAGYVDAHNLLFAMPHVARVRDVSPRGHETLDALDVASAEIHRDQPFQPSPDFVAALRTLINQPGFRSILGPPSAEGS